MLRFGPGAGPVVIVALPLFEEANRTRAFAVTILRALAARDIAGALPDLPGTGDSLLGTDRATLADWRSAFAHAAASFERPIHVVALRGGALIDTDAVAASRWHLAPIDGKRLMGEMLRGAYRAALPSRVDFRLHDSPDGPPIALFGNDIARRTLIALEEAEPSISGPLRIVRFASDEAKADRHVNIDGAALWRRAEPGNDPALATLLAGDIADWIATCVG